MKKLFYDLETTGLDPNKNGIHQISGCIEINGKDEEWFNFKVRPFDTDNIDDVALKTSHVTREQIMSYKMAQQVHNEFLNLMGKYVNKFDKKDKFFLVGYNNTKFDDQFLRAWFNKLNDNFYGSWFWPQSIDVMSLAVNHLIYQRPDMLNFKLMTVSKQFGLEVDESKLHDALYDIELTRNVYRKIQYSIMFPENKDREIPREMSSNESELLTDYLLNDNLYAIYEFNELKQKLDDEWIDNEMWAKYHRM